jgi:dTDP-4-dehydrorhamnose 3,5-epimerase
MIFTPARLPGLCLVELERRGDERGWFARSWCAREFAEHGLDPRLAQASLSFNAARGTLRGLHFQRPPHAEAKLVRCVNGAIWDVAVDLRPDSPKRGEWQGFELSAANGRALYVPAGFAHGFQTLAPDTEILYLISEFYAPDSSGGVRYDDPAFAISWPLPVTSISPRDATWPDWRADAPESLQSLPA